MSKLHVTSEYRWNVQILRIVFRNGLIRVHCSDTVLLNLLCQIEIVTFEFCLSVCISYDCIWALNFVWVYVSVMTVYEHWIWCECMYQLCVYDCIWALHWFECMYQLWLYMSIALVSVYVSVMTVYEHCIGLSVCISYDCIWALSFVHWCKVTGVDCSSAFSWQIDPRFF